MTTFRNIRFGGYHNSANRKSPTSSNTRHFGGLASPCRIKKLLASMCAGHDAVYGYRHKFLAGQDDPSTETAWSGYRPGNGRSPSWLQRCPAGYVDGMSLYQVEQSNTIDNVDPSGRYTRQGGTQVKDAGGTVTLPNKDTGDVEVWKDVTVSNQPGWMALEFKTHDPAKKSCHDAHWMQFFGDKYWDLNGKEIVPAPYKSNGTYHRSGEVYLDVDPDTGPFYGPAGVNSSDTEASMVDNPPADSDASWSKHTVLLDAFLIVDRKVYFHVHYDHTWERTKDGKEGTFYENITGGPVNALGKGFNDKNLLLGYTSSSMTKGVYTPNPVVDDVK